MIGLASEAKLVKAVIYDGPRGRGREVRLLRIPDDHVVVDLEGVFVTMGEVLAVGLPRGVPAGAAYVMLERGDRQPDGD